MANTLVAFRLDDTLLKAIDELGEKEGMNRTEIVEDLLWRGVDDEQRFVRMLEVPIQRLLVKGLAKSGLIDAVYKAMGSQADQRRVRVAKNGLKRRTATGNAKLVEGGAA